MIPQGVMIRNPDKLFIGGEWVAPLSGEHIEVESPVTEEIVARVAAAGDADMDRAVAAARKAFDEGPVADHAPGGTRRHADEDGRRARTPRARNRRRLVRTDRRARAALGNDADGLGHGHARDRRAGRKLRLDRDAQGPDGRHCGHRPRTGRRRRRHRSVECALRHHAQQGRLRADRRLHDRHEAFARDPARGLHHRRGGRGSGHSAGRRQPRACRPRGVGPPDPLGRDRQGQLHRLLGGGHAHRQRLRLAR